jgi:hypothetical protein
MTEQEEQYIHFVSCIQNLNEAWRILKIIRQQADNPLVGPAFEFALIEYSKPYTASRGKFKGNYSLGIENVPPEYRELHKEILAARHQIHAHSDLTVDDAHIFVVEENYRKYVGISKNIIYSTEKLERIGDIIDLIEKTLDSMYEKEKQLKAELPPSTTRGQTG